MNLRLIVGWGFGLLFNTAFAITHYALGNLTGLIITLIAVILFYLGLMNQFKTEENKNDIS